MIFLHSARRLNRLNIPARNSFRDNNRRGRVNFAFVERPIAALSNRPERASTVLRRSSWSFTSHRNGHEYGWQIYALWQSMVVGAVHIQRQTDDDFVRLPLFSKRSIMFQSGVPSCALIAGKGERCR